MSFILIAAVLCGAPAADIGGPDGTARPLPRMRPVLTITQEVDQLIKQEARATTNAERAFAAYQMTKLHDEIRRDPRLVASESLTNARMRLRNRLLRITKDIHAHLKREGRATPPMTDAEVLALADTEVVSQSIADHLALASSSLGGPGAWVSQIQPVGGSHGGAPGPPDYGPDLVDLIQRTIVPEFWDVNGGPGTIVYYRPLMCLVVRATSDVHHRLGGTVGALREVK